MSDDRTTTVHDHAARLSNLRNRLNDAATRATHGQLCVEPATTRKALDDLIEEVDHAYDELHPFAFPETESLRELLALSLAVERARAGDAEGAGRVLADTFGPAREVAA